MRKIKRLVKDDSENAQIRSFNETLCMTKKNETFRELFFLRKHFEILRVSLTFNEPISILSLFHQMSQLLIWFALFLKILVLLKLVIFFNLD